MKGSLAGSLVLAAAAVAAAAPLTLRGFTKIENPAEFRSNNVTFFVGLPMNNLDVLDSLFWDRSDPESKNYGKYLSFEALNRLTAAAPEAVEGVLAWARTHSVGCELVTLDSLMCAGAASNVETMMDIAFAQYHEEGKPETGKRLIAIDEEAGEKSFVSVPEHLAEHVQMVVGLDLPVPAKHFGRKRAAAAGDGAVVPETLYSLYNYGNAKGSGHSIQAAIEFQDDTSYNEADLKTFIKNTGIDSFDVKYRVGPYNGQDSDTEATLDVQYIGASGRGNTNWYWTAPSWIWSWAQTVLSGKFKVPEVMSVSWGYNEEHSCAGLGNPKPCHLGAEHYVQVTNTLLQKIALSGSTILVASGDSGAHGEMDEGCSGSILKPDFPTSSPYVLSVGATQIKPGTGKTSSTAAPICKDQLSCLTGGEEIVCSISNGALITSGGGFSNVAPMPGYQSSVVHQYLQQQGVAPAGMYNASGRAFPDVSALGHGYYIQQGGIQSVDGTSASTPVFGGVIGVLNAQRKAAGKPTLGFANPLLYRMAAQFPEAFNDITVGNNKCTEETCSGCDGFLATKGWDATTGLGTPNVSNMLAALEKMDAEIFARQ